METYSSKLATNIAPSPSAGMQAEAVTEMCSLGALLGENRRRLRDMLDLIENRLNSFAPLPTPMTNGRDAGSTQPQPPEPLPGTFASLRCMADTTSADLNRLDSIACRLRDLL